MQPWKRLYAGNWNDKIKSERPGNSSGRFFLNTKRHVPFTGNLYNPDRKKWVDLTDRTGDYAVSFLQSIPIAGKRMKRIGIAKTHTEIAGWEFREL